MEILGHLHFSANQQIFAEFINSFGPTTVTWIVVYGEENIFPSARGRLIQVEHTLVITLPGTDVQCTLPICLWDEVANHLKETIREEGSVEWKTEWLPIWVDDVMVSQCTLCKQSFNLFNRKHHCRSCGLVLCANCTPHKSTMKHLGYDDPVRICHKCYKYTPTNNSPNYTSTSTNIIDNTMNPPATTSININNNNDTDHIYKTAEPDITFLEKQTSFERDIAPSANMLALHNFVEGGTNANIFSDAKNKSNIAVH